MTSSFVAFFALQLILGSVDLSDSNYAVVTSYNTLNLSNWAEVAESLALKRNARIFVYQDDMEEVLDSLRAFNPRYIAFLEAPIYIFTNNGEEYVRKVFQLTRSLDDDPYGDALWGIITGFYPEDALKLISGPDEIEIKTALLKCCGGWLQYFYQGIYFSETNYNEMWTKLPDGTIIDTIPGPTDCTDTLVKLLNTDTFDIMVTSGHASSHDWQLHYPDPGLEGFFRSYMGQVYGDPHEGPDINIESTNPKIYYAPGNCLIGLVSDFDCMVLAWIRSGGAHQYIGYTVETWHGYMGWGISYYFLRFAGRYDFQESHYFNNQSLLFDLDRGTPGTDSTGLEYDRDVVAFYGDPACRMSLYPVTDPLYEEELTVHQGSERDTFTYRITMVQEGTPGTPGGRQPIAFLPYRIDSAEVLSIDAYDVLITDDFVLMQIWKQGDDPLEPGDTREVTFTAKRALSVGEGLSSPPKLSLHVEPNPASGSLELSFSLAEAGQVRINVYDAAGRKLGTLRKSLSVGHHRIVLKSEYFGASGIYFVEALAGGKREIARVIWLGNQEASR